MIETPTPMSPAVAALDPDTVPLGALTIRAVQKLLNKTAYQVLKLIGAGEIAAETVHNAAGGKNLQVKGDSVREYLRREQAR